MVTDEASSSFFECNDCLWDGIYWYRPTSCRWKAPPGFLTKRPLRHQYAGIIGNEDLQLLSHFCHLRLGVTDASVQDVIEELEFMGSRRRVDFDHVIECYRFIIASLMPSGISDLRLVLAQCYTLIMYSDRLTFKQNSFPDKIINICSRQ